MKTHKSFFTVIGSLAIAITVLALTFIFTGCKRDDREPYYGTWIYTRFGTKLIFSADTFIFLDENNNCGFTVSPITWTGINNENEETKDDYPAGYKVAGRVSDHHGSIGWKTGDLFDEDWAFYLNKDKNGLLEQGDNNFWWEELIRFEESAVKEFTEEEIAEEELSDEEFAEETND